MDASTKTQYSVGGVKLDQPFKIRRLGHFGLYVNDMDAAKKFYCELLGFHVSDELDFGARAKPGVLDGLKHTAGVFTRYGTDHHAFVLFPYEARKRMDTRNAMYDGVTINQITWQVGTLREVVNANDWFSTAGVRINRSGRDLPGSNWHVYPFDPDGHINELYYGIEQIGWDGLSKPKNMYEDRFDQAPTLPCISEWDEVERAKKRGVDLTAGTCQEEIPGGDYDVGGILLPRPFKITKIGPVRLFVKDMKVALDFYLNTMGFIETETVTYKGHTCHFLRCNTEHHSLALYPIELRKELGLSEHSTMMSFGLQLGDYKQLCDAIAFLKKHGVEIKHLPQELLPGQDYTAFAIDPDGHAIQLYFSMEQIGWDGRPRPASERRKVDNDNWPDALDALGDTFNGEVFMGPLG